MNPVQELDGASPPNVTANLLTGLGIDEYFSRTDSAGPATILADALGSTLGLTDSSGALDTTYTYEPFGNVTISGAANANSYQFTGRENDGTGLYYYRARYYSPTFQRFIAQDPLDLGGGERNLYAYVGNLPTAAIDPSGLLTVSIGISVNVQVGPVNVNLSSGIAVDTSGNIGSYVTGGGGAGVGAEGNGGVSFGYSNAQTIYDLAGPFANAEYGAGEGAGGSLDVFTGGSPNGQVTGGTLTLGLGGGVGSGAFSTWTYITPLFTPTSPCR